MLRVVSVQRAAAQTLKGMKDPRAIESLIATLKDKNAQKYVRMDALMALGAMRDQCPIEPLFEALKDKDLSIGEATARIIADSEDPRIAEMFMKALKESDLYIVGAPG